MGQTKTQSMWETVTTVTIGYIVAILSQYLIFPQFGIEVSHSAHLYIGLWFTVISIIRSYLIRRYFNYRHNNGNEEENPTATGQVEQEQGCKSGKRCCKATVERFGEADRAKARGFTGRW